VVPPVEGIDGAKNYESIEEAQALTGCRPAPDDQIRIISIRLSGIGQDLSGARRSTLSEPPPKRDHVPFLFGSTGIFESRA
jgi:hypothetical protein